MFRLIKNVLQNLGRRPATRKYPFETRTPVEGSRGRLEIDINACVFCGLCVRKCPADALKVSRDPKSWTLDPYRCIVCGYCVEGCPKKCLSMNKQHLNVNA